jgi:hypothetical protein
LNDACTRFTILSIIVIGKIARHAAVSARHAAVQAIEQIIHKSMRHVASQAIAHNIHKIITRDNLNNRIRYLVVSQILE